MDTGATSDQRLLKGMRSRTAIARHAAGMASVEGLNGLSIGRLATDLGISKSGVAGLFGSKEKLQLAACAAAREVYIDRVVRPAFAQRKGLPRLRSLIDNAFGYLTDPSFPGGCFRSAAVVEFDSRPGPVRDALVADRRDWLALLAKEIEHAAEIDGVAAGRDPAALAFEIEALLAAVNTELRLGDVEAVALARAIIDEKLVPAGG